MYTFLYKDNTDDRDCVAYIDLKDLKENHLSINMVLVIQCHLWMMEGMVHLMKIQKL